MKENKFVLFLLLIALLIFSLGNFIDVSAQEKAGRIPDVTHGESGELLWFGGQPDEKEDPPGIQDLDGQPTISDMVQPVYPESMRREKLSGIVYIRVLVSREGRVVKGTILKSEGGNGDMIAEAVKAIQKWRFSPAIKNSVPVDAWVTVPIRFQLK